MKSETLQIVRGNDRFDVKVERIVDLSIGDCHLKFTEDALSGLRSLMIRSQSPTYVVSQGHAHDLLRAVQSLERHGFVRSVAPDYYQPTDSLVVLRSVVISILDECMDAHTLVFDEDFIVTLPEPLRSAALAANPKAT